jgi:hypothetical protein
LILPAFDEIHISAPRVNRRDGYWRVSAQVNNQEVWFSSRDIPLLPVPESYASAYLIQAMAAGAPLRVDAPMDETWLQNSDRLQETISRWWGYSKVAIHTKGITTKRHNEDGPTVLFFSCGADSFYSLLESGQKIDALAMVYGFGMNQPRTEIIRQSVKEIGRQTRKPTVFIETNLREQVLFNSVHWTRALGGAMAAMGHLLRGEFRHALLSASNHMSYDIPYGSHWDTDPLWSSSRMTLHHIGADKWRDEKLRAISKYNLARHHLTVCYAQDSILRNCGRCAKCVRTMLNLYQYGTLDSFTVFPGKASIEKRIGGIYRIEAFRIPVYRRFMEQERDPRVRRAIQRLIDRSVGWRGALQSIRGKIYSFRRYLRKEMVKKFGVLGRKARWTT